MEQTYDLPSGNRIWELSERAIQIEKSANRSCSLSYELFEVQVNTQADKAMRTMEPGERRFFAACFQGVYVPPEQRGQDWQSEYAPAYFVSLEPSQGDTISYGPFSLSEARDCFESTYPAFDGGSVTLIKVESTIPGVSPSQLRRNALREEWEIGDPDAKKWMEIYIQSKTVVAKDVWDVKFDHGEAIWRHKGKQYESSFLEEGLQHEDRSDQNEIQSIYESEWYQGFGSECKEHLGRDTNGYYYGLEVGESDLSWHGPYNTREEAEERLSDAFLRWDERTGEREQAWEDQQIAHFEERQTLRAGQDAVELPEHDGALRHIMLPEDLADPAKRAEFWQTHADPVQETLVSLSPEDEQVRHIFIMERDVLPRRKTELAEIQQTSYGPFHARGEIEYDFIAKVSSAGTVWAIAAQHYDWDDFADRGPRLVEVVHTFHSMEEAMAWMASDRALVTPELTDPRKDLEEIVASVISTPEFEQALIEEGYSVSTFQRDWPKYGSFMALPQDYRAAINWAEHEIKARGMDQTREVEMER